MPQILMIDSLADRRFKPFFEKALADIGVGTVWNSYEKIGSGKPALEDFQKESRSCDALFLILDGGAQILSRSQDWIFGEPGFAEDKDVWVFQHCEDLKRISIRIPALKHYVVFYITNAWTEHIAKIARTFNPPQIASFLFPEARLEPLAPLSSDSLFDSSTGMARFDFSTSQPAGLKTECPYCTGSYKVHLPSEMKVMRCPVCNYFHEIKLSPRIAVPAIG